MPARGGFGVGFARPAAAVVYMTHSRNTHGQRTAGTALFVSVSLDSYVYYVGDKPDVGYEGFFAYAERPGNTMVW